MTPQSIKALAEKAIEIRGKASRDYDTEDFNGSLLIDGVTGSFGFEMHKCDRDFVAFAANHITDLATANLRLLKALERVDEAFQAIKSEDSGRLLTFEQERIGNKAVISGCHADITAILKGK